VGRRVAEVDRDRIAPVLLEERGEAAVHGRERLLPADLLEAPVRPAPQRHAQPVGIVVQLLQRVRLRAEEPLREDVLLVSADRGDVAAVGLDLEATGRLAQGARAVVGRGGQGRHLLRVA
jgi:hypothetical protein